MMTEIEIEIERFNTRHKELKKEHQNSSTLELQDILDKNISKPIWIQSPNGMWVKL